MKLSQGSSSDASYSACSRSAAFDRPNKNDRIKKIRFPERKEKEKIFYLLARDDSTLARSLARIPDHDPSKENAKGASRGCKETYSNIPTRGWDNAKVGRKLLEESRRILSPLYDDLDQLRNAVGPQKLPRRITACHRGLVKFVERGDSGPAIVSLRFRRAKCTIPWVGMSRKRRR
jgi:hypothetical protein